MFIYRIIYGFVVHCVDIYLQILAQATTRES